MATKPNEASQVISDVAKAEGGTTKGSKSAQMQSELTKQRNLEGTTAEDTQAVNDGIASTSTNAAPIDPAVQSQIDRQANFEEAANKIGGKLASDPGNITKEEADTMHRREQRAFGQTEKGGLASQTQHQVAENEKS